MSVVDDLECVSKIVQQSEKYLCGEMSKLQREFKKCNQTVTACESRIKEQEVKIQKLEVESKAQDQKITNLQTEKQSLLEQVRELQAQVDRPDAHDACRATLQRAFASALDSVLPVSNVNAAAMDRSVTDTSVLQSLHPESMGCLQITSTPLQHLPIADPQLTQTCRMTLGKRKSSATSE